MVDATTHGAVVDAWMARRVVGAPPHRQVAAFEGAFAALWRRAHRTLGDVTLTAIADRALREATARHPALATLQLGDGGLRCDGLRAEVARSSDGVALAPALRCVLVELLTILGKLTAEILSPALHAELVRLSRSTDDPQDDRPRPEATP
jgi:hypothetical protein